MNIQELKSHIDNKTLDNRNILFKISDDDFIPEQYIHQIAKDKGLEIELLDELPTVSYQANLFSEDIPDKIFIHKTTTAENISSDTLSGGIYYIIASKVKNCDIETVEVPKLQPWQIQDYAYSVAKGIDEKSLDKLIEMCDNNIQRLDNELYKLRLFSEQERPFVFKQFEKDGVFDGVSNHTIFDFSEALIQRDLSKLADLYKEMDLIDCEPLALLNILWKQFRNIIAVQLNPNPIEENTGMSSKQIWAIKKYKCQLYTKEQLFRIFEFLTGIDLKIKSGLIPMDKRGATFLRDYLVMKILVIGGNV